MLTSGTILQSRYQIVRQLGAGGMGAVYLACDQRLGNRLVVVKENLGGDPAQFQIEANILGALRHPNLPSVFDHFADATGAQYLVMDYIEGQDLGTFLQQSRGVSESVVLGWMQQIFDAVEYLHQNRIIHRDIKPQNIIITPQNRAVLVDFGIAKRMVTGWSTLSGARAATPGFSAPEQYAGGTNERSDIYSLCATLYALLTAQVPPEAPTLASGSAVLVRPTALNSQIYAQTEQAILRGMSLQTSLRFQSVAELRNALAGRSVSNPGAIPVPAPLPQARNPAMVLLLALLGGILMLCVAGSAAAIWVNANPSPTPTRIAEKPFTEIPLTRNAGTSTFVPISTTAPAITAVPVNTGTPTMDTQQTALARDFQTAAALGDQQTATALAAQQATVSAQQRAMAVSAQQTADSINAQQTVMALYATQTAIAINARQTSISAQQTADAINAQQTLVALYATQTAMARPAPVAPVSPVSISSFANKRNQLCLAVQGSSSANGAPILQKACTGAANQRWGLVPVGSYFKIVAQNSNKCMGVQGGSQELTAKIVQSDCTGADYQLWTLISYGSYFQFQVKHSSQCLDVDGFSRQDGLPMQQWTCGTSDIDNQLWQQK